MADADRHQWLTARQWLTAMAPVTRLAPGDLWRRCDLYRLHACLEAPYDLDEDDDWPSDFIARLANQAWFMLTRPPWTARRRLLALATIDVSCSLNGYRLALDRRERTMLAAEADRRVGGRESIERWLRRAVIALPPSAALAARGEALRSLPAPYRERAMVYVSRPKTRISAEDDQRLNELTSDIQEACRLVAQRRVPWEWWPPATWDDGTGALGDDVLGPIRFESPARDHRHIYDDEVNCVLNRARLWRTNLLIILVPGGGSHGTGVEGAVVPADTPTLVVRWERDELWSPAIGGNLAGRLTLVEDVASDDEVRDVVEQFVDENWPLLERSWRATEMRPLVWGPLADAFSTKLQAMPADEQVLVLRNPSLDFALLQAACDIHGLACLSTDSKRAVGAALGVDTGRFLGSSTFESLNRQQLAALFDFQHEYQVLPAETKALHREAERQQLLGILRFSLTSIQDWRDFRYQLRGEVQ